MRLTLRTMLAYLDGRILDEADAKALGKKIEESEFASGLVHRIQNSVKRAKLSVPSLQGRGMGLDPNTVAEYLDSLLPPDRVPDFERVCLESDVQLAEVASSHQILTWVVSQPAEFDDELRQRIYRLGAPNTQRTGSVAAEPLPIAAGSQAPTAPPENAGPPKATEVAAGIATPGTASQPVTTKRKIEIPEYMQAGQASKWKPLLIALALAFMVSVIGLRAMGPFNSQHPLLGGGEEVVENPAAPTGNSGTSETVPAVPAESPATATPATTAKPVAKPAAKPADPVRPSDPPKEPSSPEATTTTPTDKTAATPDPNAKPAVDPAGEPAKPAAGTTNPLPEAPSAEDPTAEPPVEVGFLKQTDHHFLVRREAGSNNWMRLPYPSKLSSGDEIKVLPTYRPEIVLVPGVQVKLVGPTDAVLLRPRDPAEPALRLPYGRALLINPGVPGTRIRLDFGDRGGVLTFADAATDVAVEVGRFLRPGSNPETEPATPVIHLIVISGKIIWQSEGSELAVPVEAGQVHALIGDRALTASVPSPPAWHGSEYESEIERLSSQTLESLVSADKVVGLSLKEAADERRVEVRSLGARCLACFDSFDPIIAEFDAAEQAKFWPAGFGNLREMVHRSPQSAAIVRESLQRLSGDDAEPLYRMLWGYSQQQLSEGEAQRLVEQLSYESLAIRVFAFENLHRITGKTHSYRPEFPENRRKTAVQTWNKRLEAGEVTHETLPTPRPFSD